MMLKAHEIPAIDLLNHIGHNLTVAAYSTPKGEIANLAIECEDCYEVLTDVDLPTAGNHAN